MNKLNEIDERIKYILFKYVIKLFVIILIILFSLNFSYLMTIKTNNIFLNFITIFLFIFMGYLINKIFRECDLC